MGSFLAVEEGLGNACSIGAEELWVVGGASFLKVSCALLLDDESFDRGTVVDFVGEGAMGCGDTALGVAQGPDERAVELIGRRITVLTDTRFE